MNASGSTLSSGRSVRVEMSGGQRGTSSPRQNARVMLKSPRAKSEYRRELRETGLAPQIAASLAAFRAAQERVDLRDAIANQRTVSSSSSISSSAKPGANL